MSDATFEKFKALLRDELEEARNKRNLKRSELDDIIKGAITYHGNDDDPLFRASQLYELFRLPDEIMEEERMRGMGYEI
jgi:hypothetical protein